MPEYFESYADLRQAIQLHPILKKYRKPHYFMEEDLMLPLLNPFIWVSDRAATETTGHYDELVKLVGTHVQPRTILSIYETLTKTVSQLNSVIEKYRFFMRKMHVIPEVQEYLKKHPSQ